MKTTIMLFVVVFMTMASPAFGDIGILVRADLSTIQTFEGKGWSEEVFFKEGKAVWPKYGDFYFAFYNDKALEKLVKSDSTKVVLVPSKGEITPSFGNLYMVIKNLLWGLGESYGLDPEIYYVWPVKFATSGIGLKDENGILCHKGIVPFGDNAIETMKLKGEVMSKDFLVYLANEK